MLYEPRQEIMDHLPAMRAFAVSLTRDPTLAEDIVQDAAIKAWMNFDKFEPGTNLRAWLLTILRNTFYSEKRKSRHETDEVDPDGPQAPMVPPYHDGVLQMRDFRRVFSTLGLENREALLLVGGMGFSYEETAEMCGVPVGTVKSRVLRARRQLAEQLGWIEKDVPSKNAGAKPSGSDPDKD
ncbi:MAG: sigma-70 family RNA polymerase sigma factor [Paracoccaceae bacterium]